MDTILFSDIILTTTVIVISKMHTVFEFLNIDLWTGKAETDVMEALVTVEKPFLVRKAKSEGQNVLILWIMTIFLIFSEFWNRSNRGNYKYNNDLGRSVSFRGLAVESFKELGPRKLNSVIEIYFALLFAIWFWAFSFLNLIDGKEAVKKCRYCTVENGREVIVKKKIL